MKKRNYILSAVILILLVLFIIRLVSPTEIDDIHPNIECPEIEKYNPDILWVIPLYQGKGISENKSWCEKILLLNKTLGMHGIYHNYEEFYYIQSLEELNKGIKEFKECFGYEPEIFKPPQLKINSENKKLVKQTGLKLNGKINQAMHKVYHCNNQGKLPNWFVEIF
jgi:predicted deacetylase